MTAMKVTVTLPARLFNKLADLGEVYDMRVDELLIELSAQALARRAPDLSHPVVARWREGMSDKQIAADLGMTNAAVADARRRHGLPANSRRGGLGRVKAETGLSGPMRRSGGRVASPPHENTSTEVDPATGLVASNVTTNGKKAA